MEPIELRGPVPSGPGVPVPPGGAVSWRVSPPLTWAKVIATLAFIGVGVIFRGDPTRVLAISVAVLLIGGYALRDLVAPVRLSADPGGLTVVSGYRAARRLPWATIEHVRVDERSRLGLRTEMLEIDAGDSLHLLSTYDLNAPVADVAETIARLYPSSGWRVVADREDGDVVAGDFRGVAEGGGA